MVTATLSEREVLSDSIAKGAHWREVIRPLRFEAARIASLAECERLLRATTVRLRGWEYPFINERTLVRDADSLSSTTPPRDYWQLYQSGQFVSLLGLREDDPATRETVHRRLKSGWCANDLPRPYVGHIDPVEVIYHVSEVFEFAGRLAEREAVGPHVVIELGWRNVHGRVLGTPDFRRGDWRQMYVCTVDKLDHPAIEVTALQLIARRREMAIDAALWLFDRFGWSPGREAARLDQSRLFGRLA